MGKLILQTPAKGRREEDEVSSFPSSNGYYIPPAYIGIFLGVAYDCWTGAFYPASPLYTCFFLFLGCILLFNDVVRRKIRWTGAAYKIGALVSLILVFLVIGNRLLFNQHDLPIWWASSLQFMANCFGFKVALSEHPITETILLSLRDSLGWHRHSIGLERVVPSVLCALLAWITFSATELDSAKRKIGFTISALLALGVFCLFRLFVLLILMQGVNAIWIFWSPVITVFSYFPAVLILNCIRRFYGKNNHPIVAPRWQTWMSYISVILCFTAVGATYWYIPGGAQSNGKVLLDDYHSNWEWSEGEFGKDSFGERATYNAQAFRHLLSQYWKVDVNSKEVLTEDMLSKYKVLILKMPTRPFEVSEIDAVEKFVEQGGGLWMIGDHTNLFGSSTYLNKLAAKFGYKFELTDQFELTSGNPTVFKASKFWNHPIANGLDRLEFLTSCTLSAPIGADVISQGGMGVEPAEYSHVNFFGDIKIDTSEQWGQFIQMAASFHGKGRVVAFSDSTFISTFCIFFDTKPLLMVKTVDFLNRSSGAYATKVRPVLLTISPFLLLLGLLSISSLTRVHGHLMIGSFLFVGTIALLGYVGIESYPIPERKDSKWVEFDVDHSNFKLPSMIYFDEKALKDPSAFDNWFLNFYRMGVEPYVGNPLRLADDPIMKIVIYPSSNKLTKKERGRLLDWVKTGNRLMIMADWSNKEQLLICQTLLEDADLATSVSQEPVVSCLFSDQAHVHQKLAISEAYRRKEFGTDLELDVTCVQYGKGELIFLGGAKIFSRIGLGSIYNVIQPDQKVLSELQYSLIESLIGKDEFDRQLDGLAEEYIKIKKRMRFEEENRARQ